MKDKNKKIILLAIILVIIIIGIVLLILTKNTAENKKNKDDYNYLILAGQTQSEIDREIQDNLNNNKYNLDNAAIYVNPYKISPLTAMITFYTDSKESVEVTVSGKNNNDLVYNYEEKTNEHYIPIYGLYPNETNTISVKLSNGKVQKFEINTEKVENIVEIIANEKNVEKNNSIYFITSPITMDTVGVDSYGNLRWFLNSNYYHNVEVLNNNHILIGTNTMNNDGLSTDLLEIDYLGRIYKTYSIDSGYLNDFYVKSNGNIILTSKSDDRVTYSDLVIEIDEKNGKIVKTIDIYKLFENIDNSFTNNLNSEFFYNSGIEYYEETDTLLLTYWGGEFVISLDYSDSSINWIFSNPNNFTNMFSKYLLVSDNGVYPKSMHSATLNGNTLKVFDNGYSTNNEETNVSQLKGSISNANTYEITNKTIKLIKSLNDNNYFSYALADYKITNDSEIVLYGRELNNLDFSSGININDYSDLYSVLNEYKDGEKIVDLRINRPTLTVTKINLSDSYNFEFGEEIYINTSFPTVGEPITEDILNNIKNLSNNDIIEFKFDYSNNILKNNVMFMNSDSVKLIVKDSNDNGLVYNLKEVNSNSKNNIVFDLNSGRYELYIIFNDMYYKVDQIIDIK